MPTTRVPVTEVTRLEETSIGSGPSQRPTQPDVQLPSGKEEIVARFNDAINGVKPNATKVTHVYSAVATNGEAKVPEVINTAMKVLGGTEAFIDDQVKRNSKTNMVYTGNDIKTHFPVEGEAYASKLTADDVEVAEVGWSDDGKNYLIGLKLKDDPRSANVKHGQGHAPKAFNVVTPQTVNDNVPGVLNSLIGADSEIAYHNSYITIAIDAETGHVVEALYLYCWTIYFGDDIVVPLASSDGYLFSY